jgi:hypothetical protein
LESIFALGICGLEPENEPKGCEMKMDVLQYLSQVTHRYCLALEKAEKKHSIF